MACICFRNRLLPQEILKSPHVIIGAVPVAKGAMPTQIFSISCCFVLREAVSQTKYYCSLKAVVLNLFLSHLPLNKIKKLIIPPTLFSISRHDFSGYGPG